MSDNILKIISTNPDFIPNRQTQKTVEEFLSKVIFFPGEASISVTDFVRFIDQGANFENLYCPICAEELGMEWWQLQMDIAFQSEFSDLSVSLPCCHNMTSLNDLKYELSAGFARFLIEIRYPPKNIEEILQPQLEEILGTPLRLIWAHY